MSVRSTEAIEQSPFVIRAEQALRSLHQNVTDHVARESRLRRVYGEWHETWLSRAEQLRQQISELEARLAPWMPRGESVRLAVVSRGEETN